MTGRGSARTYYGILGLVESATEQQIRDAYKVRARAAHPDAGGSTEEMAAINSAYRVLRSSESRAAYDAVLARDRSAEAAGREPDSGTTEPPPASSPSWGRPTDWGGSSGSSRATRAPRRPAPPRADRRRPAGSGPVLDVNPDQLSWQPVTGTASVVPGPPRWVPRQRRTRILVGTLTLWILWTLLPLIITGTASFVAPGEQMGLSDAWFMLTWSVAPAVPLFLSRAGCIGMGVHIVAGLAGIAFAVLLQVQGAGGPSLWVTQVWIVVGVALYFVAGAAWRRPAQPLPRYLPIPEAGVREYFRWGHVEPDHVGHTAAMKQAAALTCQLIEMLRTRLPGLRMAVRVRASQGGMVPHVLVCGRRIALVYSIVGLTGDYRWDRGALAYVAPTGAVETVLSNLGPELAGMRRLFPEAGVRAWVVLHPFGHADPNLLTRGKLRGVRVAWAQDFLEEVGSWFVDGSPTTVRQDLLTRLIHATV